MEDINLKLTFRHVFGYILAYLFWFLTASIGMLAMLEARNALNMLWPVLGSGVRWTWILRPVDRFGLVFLGLVWLVYEIFVENHYRTAITNVRIREYRGKTAPALASDRANPVMRQLARMGLDLLVPRFIATILPPIAIWLVSLFLKWLAVQLLLR